MSYWEQLLAASAVVEESPSLAVGWSGLRSGCCWRMTLLQPSASADVDVSGLPLSTHVTQFQVLLMHQSKGS